MTKKEFMAMKDYQPDTRGSIEQMGFTLVELMVGMVVAVIVVAAAFTILTTTSKALRPAFMIPSRSACIPPPAACA